MLLDTIIRAWKDPEYRQDLSEEEQQLLPENPAGAIELTDEELDMAVGGHRPSWRPPNSRSFRPSNSGPWNNRPSGSWSNRPSGSWNNRPSGSWSNRPSGSWRPSNSGSFSHRGRW
jgi:mersacidin/lichenicidin family type 2 lantibiotic